MQARYLRADLDTEVVADAFTYVLTPGLLQVLRGGLSPAERERYRDGVQDLLGRGVRPGA